MLCLMRRSKATEYIGLLGPVIDDFARGNEEEMRLLAQSGEIGLEIERLGERGADDPSGSILSGLAELRPQIDSDISALNKRREATIDRANRETSETSFDGEE